MIHVWLICILKESSAKSFVSGGNLDLDVLFLSIGRSPTSEVDRLNINSRDEQYSTFQHGLLNLCVRSGQIRAETKYQIVNSRWILVAIKYISIGRPIFPASSTSSIRSVFAKPNHQWTLCTLLSYSYTLQCVFPINIGKVSAYNVVHIYW